MDRIVSSSFLLIAIFFYQFGFSLGWTGQIVLDVPRDLSSPSVQISPHIEDCHIYYYNTFPMTCGSLLGFNKATLRCDSLNNVAKVDPVCGEVFVLEALEALYDEQEALYDQEDLEEVKDQSDEEGEGEFVDEEENLTGTQRGGWHGKRLGFGTGGQNVRKESVVGEVGGGLEEVVDKGRGKVELAGELHDQGDSLVGSGWHGNRNSFVGGGLNGRGQSFVAEDGGGLEEVAQQRPEQEFASEDDQENNVMGSLRGGWHGNRNSFIAGGHNGIGQSFVVQDGGGLGGAAQLDGGQQRQELVSQDVQEGNIMASRRTGWHGNRLNFVASGQNRGGVSFIRKDGGAELDDGSFFGEDAQQRQEGDFVGGVNEQEDNLTGSQRTGWYDNRWNVGGNSQRRSGAMENIGSEISNIYVEMESGQDARGKNEKKIGWHHRRNPIQHVNGGKGGDQWNGNNKKEENQGVGLTLEDQWQRYLQNKEILDNADKNNRDPLNKLERGGGNFNGNPYTSQGTGEQFLILEQKSSSELMELGPNNIGQIDRLIQVNPGRINNQIGHGGEKSTGRRRDINGNFIKWNGIKIKQLKGRRFGPNEDQDNGDKFDGEEHETSGGWNIFRQLWKNKVNK